MNTIPDIIEATKTLKLTEVAKKFNITLKLLNWILEENGVKLKRTRLNESKLNLNIDYFDIIDCPRKAYWLGFLSADGCLKNNKVRLVSKDLDVIEKFKRDINSEHKITECKSLDKRTNKTYISYHIQITNQLFTKKLNKYIPTNKSESFLLPDISEDYYPEFLAGMIDGDGSFSLTNNKTKTLRINLISTKECLFQIQAYIYTTLKINKTNLQQVTKNKPNVWKLYIYAGADRFLNLIYRQEDKSMYLKRKQENLNIIYKEKQINPPSRSFKRRPVKVYNLEGELLYNFTSTLECTNTLKMSTATLFTKLKNGLPYKEMIFKGDEMIIVKTKINE